jgi:hypothetical protein
MDVKSGKLWSLEQLEARGAGPREIERLLPVPGELVSRVQYLPRRLRRAWAERVQAGEDAQAALVAVQRECR